MRISSLIVVDAEIHEELYQSIPANYNSLL